MESLNDTCIMRSIIHIDFVKLIRNHLDLMLQFLADNSIPIILFFCRLSAKDRFYTYVIVRRLSIIGFGGSTMVA